MSIRFVLRHREREMASKAKVFIVKHDYQADHKVFFVDHDYQEKNEEIISPGVLVDHDY